ncbi:hypothetical protein [Nonomuraea sp. KM90]|uniref:hypothetical protein n=1 Tax=Nonomuraea sp. KM90 TaxID=3457428 RepID=UPI003FCCFDB2
MELLAEQFKDPESGMKHWLEEVAERWSLGEQLRTEDLHPLVAYCRMSSDLDDPDAFQQAILAEPQDVAVVFSARLHDDTTVVRTSMPVRVGVTR